MAFIFADPGNGYSTMADAARRGWSYTNGGSPISSAGRWGDKCMRIASQSLARPFAVAAGKIILHYAVYVDPGSVAGEELMRFYNNSGADLCLRVGITAANAIQITDQSGSVVHTGTAGVFTRGAWHVLAVEAEIGASSGTVRVWFDVSNAGDPPTISLSSIDMQSSGSARCDVIRLQNNGNAECFAQDVMIYDTSGSGDWAAYLGDKRIRTLLPSGAGGSTSWTPSAGSNYQCVDDVMTAADDADSTYVSAVSGDGADLYAFANLPSGTTGIVGVILESTLRKTDAGDPGTLKQRMRESSTNVDSAALVPSTAYETFQHFSVDVPGGTGWTEADVNALEAGHTL
jgi:hypothetical protein